MKVVFLLYVMLICLGAEAESSKSNIEEKRKFVSISNKAKGDAVVRCKSDKHQIWKKTLKPGEKVRWGLPRKGGATATAICHVDVGSKASYFLNLSMFVDNGVMKLKLGGGEWKSFELIKDDDNPCGKGRRKQGESPMPAPPPMKLEHGYFPIWESSAPDDYENSLESKANKKALPPTRRRFKPRNPRSATLAHGRKLGLRNSPAPAPAPSRATQIKKAPSPMIQIHGHLKTPPPQSQEQDTTSDAPLPQPASTFYTCIKEDTS